MRSTGNRFRNRYGWLAVLLPAAMVLAACSSSSKSTGTPAVSSGASSGSSSAAVLAAPATVTFSELNFNAGFTVSYAARGIGAFDAVAKKFNTKITFNQVGTAATSLNAMLGGSADVSMSALSGYLAADAGGKDVVAAFPPFIGGGGVLIGAKKYETSRGTDIAKYAGATFGYTAERSASQLYMKVAAEHAGLDWDKLPHVAFGMPSAGLPLLQAGRVDIAAVDPRTAALAIAAGTAYLVLNLNDPTTAVPVLGTQVGTVFGFTKAFVTKYPDLAKALIGALIAGLNAVKKVANDPEAVLALFPADIKAKLTAGWAGSWKLAEPGITASDGTIPQNAVADTLSFAQKAGLLTAAQAAKAPDVVDNALATG